MWMKTVELFKQAMAVNMTENLGERELKAEAFFRNLRQHDFGAQFNWADEVFEGLHVKENRDKTALIWADMETGEENTFSYGEVAGNANKLLNFMRKRGIEKCNNLYMMIPIVPETWFTTLAGIKGGFIAVPTATSMTVRELQFRFEIYPPDAVMASEEYTEILDEALEIAGIKPKIKIVLGKKQGWLSYSDTQGESETAEPATTLTDDLLFCFFTSGTTGLPKRVGHSAISYPVGHLSTSVMIGIRPDDIHHNLSAPGWAKWAWSSFFAPFNMGATVAGFNFKVLDGDKYLQYISDNKVTCFCGPPTAWRMFVSLDLGKYDFKALRQSVSAGEPLNPETIEKWKKATGNEIRDFYGQTESTAMIGNAPWMEGRMRFGSFGRPSGMYDIALLDEEGKEVTTPGQTGHIVVQLDKGGAKGLFSEYIGNPEKMQEVVSGNYYYTGDWASFDEDGYWWFEGRADDVIKSSDFRVGPFEVESAMVEHPSVLESAVVGAPDPKRHQLVKAYVLLNKGYTPSKELALELFRHTIGILAKFKIPRIIQFVDVLPKTISGKIRRIELREQEKKKTERQENEYFYTDFPELSSKKKE